jgi:predicted MFS family arabinose efflux permease
MLFATHGLGPTAAGLIGIPGAAGILVARPAGRWMDRSGVGPVVTAGIGLVMAAFLVFSLGAYWVAAIVAVAILLDCGLRAAMVANQTLVTSVDPKARSRLNTVFASHVWGGNASDWTNAKHVDRLNMRRMLRYIVAHSDGALR